MSAHYQCMLVLFEKWASDCTLFVKGEESLFPEPVHKDDQFNILVQPNEKIHQSCIQCLELIFGSFFVVSNRMLKDNLKGGKYAELMIKAKSTSTTNAEAKRDFGMLDCFKKLKPNTFQI